MNNKQRNGKRGEDSRLLKAWKKLYANRAVLISVVVILVSIAVITAVTVANNRSKKERIAEIVDDQNRQTQSASETTPESEPVEDEPTAAVKTPPELALPVQGMLTKAHSVDVQVFSKTLGDYRTHLGVDIATAEGAPVCAAADGVVERLWEDPMMGFCVALSHEGDAITVYKNLARDYAEGVTVGATVKQGQLLGTVGDSAVMEMAEEPHLHLEMTVAGLAVDPMDYFGKAVASALTEDADIGYEDTAETK